MTILLSRFGAYPRLLGREWRKRQRRRGACLCTCACVHECLKGLRYVSVCVYVCIYVRNVCMRIYFIYIYIHTHTYIYEFVLMIDLLFGVPTSLSRVYTCVCAVCCAPKPAMGLRSLVSCLMSHVSFFHVSFFHSHISC
jgi:hypothetical protein